MTHTKGNIIVENIKLTKNQKELKIPFILDWYETRGAFHETYNKAYRIDEFRDNIPFKAKLKYYGYTRGRSALNIQWIDQKTNTIYHSSMTLLDIEMKNNTIKDSCIEGIFYFRKQGTSILLEKYYQ